MLPSGLNVQKHMHTPKGERRNIRSLNVILEGKKGNYGSMYSEPI